MNKYEIVKFVDEEVKLDVNISPLEKTIWISIEQMSVLFERDRSVIGKHIKKIYLEKELNERKKVLTNRANTFIKECEKVNLKTLPFSCGFFITIPCNNPLKTYENLVKRDVHIIPLDNCIRIPTNDKIRSLNVSNVAAVAIFGLILYNLSIHKKIQTYKKSKLVTVVFL